MHLIGKILMSTPVERFEEHAQQIEPLLFLGDSNSSAVPIEQLKQRNIKNILIAGMGLTRYHPPEEINYYQIKVIDVPIFNILELLPGCFEFIDAAQARNEAVLVHCAMGRSRSCSVVAAFLMAKYKISYNEAMFRIRRARREVDPNSGFVNQLQLFEKMNFTLVGDSKSHKEYINQWKPRPSLMRAINEFKSLQISSPQHPPAETGSPASDAPV